MYALAKLHRNYQTYLSFLVLVATNTDLVLSTFATCKEKRQVLLCCCRWRFHQITMQQTAHVNEPLGFAGKKIRKKLRSFLKLTTLYWFNFIVLHYHSCLKCENMLNPDQSQNRNVKFYYLNYVAKKDGRVNQVWLDWGANSLSL